MMQLYRIDVYTDCGYQQVTRYCECRDMNEAEYQGELVRKYLDPEAMYEVTELHGIKKALAIAAMRRVQNGGNQCLVPSAKN